MNQINPMNNRPSTALLLAAGMGTRLQPLTADNPKCLTEINGVPILHRLVECLLQHGFKRLVVVVGHLEYCIRDYLERWSHVITIDYIVSPVYKTTNNIYSLWLAREAIKEPFLLIESDLVFDECLFEKMLYPDRIAVSHILPWMNGTTVTMDNLGNVSAFHSAGQIDYRNRHYKTVNMYSFSPLTWQKVAFDLDRYIMAGRVHEYYEAVFGEMVANGSILFQSVLFDTSRWYEIDTLEDMYEAERLFADTRSRVYENTNKVVPAVVFTSDIVNDDNLNENKPIAA